MYNFIFWVIYNRNINRDKGEWLSRNNASVITFFALFIHIMLIVVILKKYFHFNAKANLNFLTFNKSFEFFLVLLCFSLTYSFYTKKRIKNLETKYSNSENIADFGGYIVALLVFIPLISIIIISS